MIGRNGSTHQRQPGNDPLADYPMLRADRDRRLGTLRMDEPARTQNTEAQESETRTQNPEPNSSEAVDGVQRPGAPHTPPGADARPRPHTPPGAPESCAPAPLGSVHLYSVSGQPQPLPEYLRELFATARQAEPPKCAARFRTPGMRLLVTLCRELQRDAEAVGNEAFFLSCHVAARFLDDNTPPSTASRWLGMIEHAGVIVCVKRGTPKLGSLANEYRYLGD